MDIMISLVCKDQSLRDEFLVKVFKSFESRSPSFSSSEIKKLTASRLCSAITRDIPDKIQFWSFKLEERECSFLINCDSSQRKQHPCVYIVLLSSKQMINRTIIQLIKDKAINNLNLLVVVDRSQESTQVKQQEGNMFHDQVACFFDQEMNVKLKKEDIVDLSLDQAFDIRLSQFSKQLSLKIQKSIEKKLTQPKSNEKKGGFFQWVTDSYERIKGMVTPKSKQSQKRLPMSESPGPMRLNFQRIHPREVRERTLENCRKNARESLNLFIGDFQVEDINKCMTFLLTGNIEGSLGMIHQDFKKAFIKKLQRCIRYREYLEELAFQNVLKYLGSELDSFDPEDQRSMREFFKDTSKDIFQTEKETDDFDSLFVITANGILSKEQLQLAKDKMMSEILVRFGLTERSIENVIRQINNGCFTTLSQLTDPYEFYSIQYEIFHHQEFNRFLNMNKAIFIGKISYFQFYITTAKDMDNLLNSIMSEENSDTKDVWIAYFNRCNKKQKLNVIESEIKQLRQIQTYANKEGRQYFVELLEELMKKMALESYKHAICHLENLQKEHNLTIGEAETNLEILERQMSTNPIYAPHQYNVRKEIYQNIVLLHEIKEMCLKKMGYDSFNQLAQYFMKIMSENKLKMPQLSDSLLRQRSLVRSLLANNNLIQYCNAKAKQIRCGSMYFFFQNYEEQIQRLMINVVFEEAEKTILLPEKMRAFEMASIVAQAFKISKENLIFECKFQKEVIVIDEIDMLIKKPQQINCYNKMSTKLQLKDSFFKFNVSKHISKNSLKKLAFQRLKRQNIQLIEQKTFLQGMFGESNQPVEISNSLELMEMKERGSLKFLIIRFLMNVSIFYEAELFQFQIEAGKTIDDLKVLIFEKTKIPIKSQCLLYARQDNSEEQIFSQRLDEIEPNSTSITFTLLSKAILEHYGFHENYPLSFKQYIEFYIERDQDLQDMIDSCSLKKEEEKNFFDQLIRFLYSAVKRKFPFSYITDQIRDKMLQKNGQQIWSGKDFTQQFLVYYLLYNADNKLRIELMNILRTFVPLPLYLRTFNRINDVKKQWKINDQIIWLLHSGLCVTSIGFHTENIAKQKGKTFLNNQLFFTNFQQSHEKHPISEGCPEIFPKVLGGIIPINFIDVPSQTPENITHNILSVTKFLIIHSWVGKKESQQKIRQIKSIYNIQFVICFLRDFQNKQETNMKVRNVKFDEGPFLELHNLEQNAANKKDPAFIKILRDKLWDYQSKAFAKKDREYSKCQDVLYLFNNKIFNQYEQKMAAIRNNFFDLKVVFDKYEEIKNLKRQKNLNFEYHVIEKKEKDLVAKKVAIQYQEVLLFISKNSDISQILMLRLRQTLKQLKNEEERKYYIINQYKKKMILLPATKRQEFQILMEKAVREINALPKMKKIQKKATQKEMVEQLSNAFQYFQNEVKSMFFTIEYAWRQLQYLTKTNHRVQLKDLQLLDFLIDTKRKEIANSQPFEILDGDLLQMPKNIISKSFQGRKDRVAVITILGPQSSGKSTLLNFLFGCDFGTSEGRCTKGVYGTYFEFNKNILTNCDGIFLIDTEGLFATVNKKDSAKRKDFDSKLVLFCLAISDFVIVNTKGNLDSESTRILKSNLERLSAVGIEPADRPEIYLVLNQNNSGNLMTSQADINSMREIFSNENTFSLNQAFNLTELSKKDISILPEDENVVKRQPREQFLALTNPIKQSLMTKIEAKRNIKQISVAIDFMEKLWTTIESFPDLGKSSSKKCQQLEASINEWKICKFQDLRVARQEIFNKFKQGLLTQKKSHQALNSAVQNAATQFKFNFLTESILDAMSEEQVMKAKLEEKTIQLGFESIKYELRYNIKDLQKDKMAEKCKTEGSEYQKEAIRVVKKKQRDEKRELTQQEKEKYFNEAFNKSLEKIQQIQTPQKQLETYFQRTFQFYSNSLSTSDSSNDKKTAGLPKAEWKCDLKMNFQTFSEKIRSKIEEKLGKDSNQYIEYRKNPPTKILDQSTRTDAKLNYFNMRNYFNKKKVIYYFEISPLNLRNCLKTETFNHMFTKEVQRKERFEDVLRNCYQEINKILSLPGFKIANFQQFIQYYIFFTSNKIFHIFKNEPKLQIQLIEEKSKTNSKASNNSIKKQKQEKNQIQHLYQMMDIEEPDIAEKINECQVMEIQQKSSLYIDQNILQQKIDMLNKIPQSKANKNKPQATFLANCIKQIIKWKQIQKEVKRGKQFKVSQQKINKDIGDIINRDLAKIGIISRCQDYYTQIFQKQHSSFYMRFDSVKNCPNLEKEDDFYAIIGRMSVFDGKKLKGHLNKSYDQQSINLRLAAFKQETFEVSPQYRQTRQLQTYISTSTNEVFYNLKSDTMKQFVFSQLTQKQSWSKFFSNLNKIVEKSPNYFNRDTITNIYVDVCKEIVEFNNDLNQVSHKLTLLFSGYAHLYTIYMLWKKFSEMAVEEANKPYNDLLKTKAKKLEFFMKETSNNDNTKSEGESDRFINEVLDYCKQIIEDHKLKTNKNQAQRFKHDNPRKAIQQKIDRECFSTTSKEDDWISYLTDPAKVIEDKYESLTKLSLKNLKSDYQKCDKLTELIQQFKEAIKLILSKLKATGVSQDTIHTDIFSIVKKTNKDIIIADNEVLQIIDGMVMDYLLDVMIQEPTKIYMHNDFNIELNPQYEDIKVIREPTPGLQALVAKLRQKNMVITRLFLFVDMVNRKLQQKSMTEESIQVEEFANQIKTMIEFKQEDEKNFRSLMNIKICKQLCPGCSRICGVEEAHINKHECKYGHQMRALGGVKLNNGDASVMRCEDVHPMNIVEFNGIKRTWLEFKEFWENKTEGSWIFSDLASDPNKELFYLAWDICGQTICRQKEMKYVKSNAIDQQKVANGIMQHLHYIFALDDSGSMYGTKWPQLMNSFKSTIQKIQQMQNSEEYIRISIIQIGSTNYVHQENVTPRNVNMSIPFRQGGTNFTPTFAYAYQLMQKYRSSSKVRFICMTDGEAEYPAQEVAQIKALKGLDPTRIQYFGIEFQASGKIMKQISAELDGRNTITYTGSQLTSTYFEIINRK